MQKEEFYNLLENPNLLNQETLPEIKKLTEQFPWFQAAWLLYLKNLKLITHSDFHSELKKAAPLIADRKQLYWLLHPETAMISGKFSYENQSRVSSQYLMGDLEPTDSGDNLIDKFLSTKPGKIKVGKHVPEDSPENSDNEIIAKSVTETDELITETLAMIYYDQKKYDKAIEAFQKLSLKYPEKSVYFAGRIEEIEKLKNI